MRMRMPLYDFLGMSVCVWEGRTLYVANNLWHLKRNQLIILSFAPSPSRTMLPTLPVLCLISFLPFPSLPLSHLPQLKAALQEIWKRSASHYQRRWRNWVLSCSPNAFKLQLKLAPKPQLCKQIRARPLACRHLNLMPLDVQQVLVQPSWTGRCCVSDDVLAIIWLHAHLYTTSAVVLCIVFCCFINTL